ncbi:unnamed protein product [Linum tenue]|uniref:TF-B3 domain-containing protein n=1 Tax=Linum tenue TaxID=586396 RepID=A0AAV0L669_9ROSI|nr:unnamed protein product [Linum tenue]
MANQTPSFIKVLVGCFSKKLRIPDSFVYEFGDDLYGKLVLKPNIGNPAIVSVEWGSRGCFFETGWPSFVKDHQLQEGDYLVFNFIGSKIVDVVIYNPTGCVKRSAEVQTSEHRPSSERNHETEPSLENARNGKRNEGRREVETRRSCRRSSGRNLETEQLSKTREGMGKGANLKPREAPIKTESEEGYSSGNDSRGLAACFQVGYKKYMTYYVCIPWTFSETTSLAMKKTAQLQDPSGKVWPVTVISGRQGPYQRFTGGWPAFAGANGLALGDRIEFNYKPELGLIQVKIHKPKNNTCNDSEGGKRPWKRAGSVIPERSKLCPSYGRNRQTERSPRPRKCLKGKRGAPMKAESSKLRKGHSSVNNVPPGLADSFEMVYKKHNERCNFVCMPVRFSETTKLSLKETAQLQDSSGKVWAVRVISGGKGLQKRFSGGWQALAAANGVAIGDRIEFSYRPKSGLVQVKIHRQMNNACKDSEVGKRPRKETSCYI